MEYLIDNSIVNKYFIFPSFYIFFFYRCKNSTCLPRKVHIKWIIKKICF